MSDLLPLDHLIYAVPDLEEAIAHFEKQLGVRAWFGGRHDGLGTHNAIVPLQGQSYVELIALDPQNPAPAQAPPFGLAESNESRLVTWAVRSLDIDQDAARARAAGYDVGIVIPVSRTQPDGVRLDWRLSVRPEPVGDGLIPFVIDWETAPHPSRHDESELERCTLRSFEAEHPEPATIEQALAALGARLDVSAGKQARLRATLEGPGGRLELH